MTSLIPRAVGGGPGAAPAPSGAVHYAAPPSGQPSPQSGGAPQPGASGRAMGNAPPSQEQPQIDQPPGQAASWVRPLFAGMFRVAGQNPYTPGELALLALAGLASAMAGALGPALWAAASRTTTALRTE